MNKISIFEGIKEENIKFMLNCFDARKISFNKNRTIASYINSTNLVGIILSGSAELIRYDYDGNRTIVETLDENSIFGDMFYQVDANELSVIAKTEVEVLFIPYDAIIKRCKRACPFHSILVNNVLRILSEKIVNMNERIEVITKRSIREKLLAYFDLVAKRKFSRSFTLPFALSDLADYLSIDRSAMMREMKNLKDDGIISAKGRKITLLY